MPLAAGGMARIYIGRTTGIGSFERHVVLKLILPERANDVTAVQMFLDEARLAASLNHQNVAQVFEVGEDQGIHYLAMEYVHGQDLRALLAKAGSQGTRVPLDLALTVIAGGASGLNHAHERRGPDGVPLGIVHRDVSPSNFMIGYDGSVKLLDFGIAKATSRSIETQSGIIKGKFAYMAPEQCRGRDVDRRSDVFSLGIILYEITTQHRCFRADSDFDTMHRIVTGDVVRPTRLVQGYPPALEAIVMKALAVDANQRYQSAGLLLEAIENFAMATRMSTSTMALGRFMRDMFGDAQEPWLSNSGRVSAPEKPKETTISNTDGSGTGQPVDGTAPLAAPRTVLDLPRGENAFEESSAAEWNAKSYPTGEPAYASLETLMPEPARTVTPEPPARATPPVIARTVTPPSSPPPARSSQPSLEPPRTPPQSSQPIFVPPMSPPLPLPGLPPASKHADLGPGSNPALALAPSGSNPPPFQTPVSTSGPALLPTAGARASYNSGPLAPIAAAVAPPRADVSYARYPTAEPPAESPELELGPNRRPLYIGLGVASVGFVVVMVMTMGSNKDDNTAKPVATPVVVAVDASVAVEPAVIAPAPVPPPAGSNAVLPHAAVVAPPVPPPVEELVTLHIETEPVGSEVTLDGKSLGVTPLDLKRKRGAGTVTLQLHHAHYSDFTTKVDVSGDVSRTITLKKLEDKPIEHRKDPPVVIKHDPPKDPKHVDPPKVHVDPKVPPKVPVNADPKVPVKPVQPPTSPPPKKIDCQPPGQANPFTDSRPICKN